MNIFLLFTTENDTFMIYFSTFLSAEDVPAGRAEGGALQPAAVPAAAQAHQAAPRLPRDGEGKVVGRRKGGGGAAGGVIPRGLQHHADHPG